MASQTDEVALDFVTSDYTSCSLSFLSPGPAALLLGYRMVSAEEVMEPIQGEKYVEVISRASRSIRDHPLLANIKHLRIHDRHTLSGLNYFPLVTNEVGRLFKSMGHLEELTLDISDPGPYLFPFVQSPRHPRDVVQGYPRLQIKTLTIVEWFQNPLKERFRAAVVKFAKSQHMLGTPFERVVFCTKESPADMEERLQPWVGAVRFSQEKSKADD
jgi:hypothetical protein